MRAAGWLVGLLLIISMTTTPEAFSLFSPLSACILSAPSFSKVASPKLAIRCGTSLHLSRGLINEISAPRDPGALGIVHAWEVRSRIKKWRRRRRGRGRRAAGKGSSSEKEEDEKLRLLAATVAPFMPPPSAVFARPDAYSSSRMLRFLRKDKARDPESAAQRFLRYLAWREEEGVDMVIGPMLGMLGEEAGEPREFHRELPEEIFLRLSSMFAVSVPPPSGAGGGVTVQLAVGEWDTSALMACIGDGEITKRHFLLYWVYQYELIHRRLYAQGGGGVERADLNGDMRRVSMKQLSKGFVKDILKDWLKMTQDHYPETVKVIYFSQPPAIIRAVWAVVARFVSKSTQEKVVMVVKRRARGGRTGGLEPTHT